MLFWEVIPKLIDSALSSFAIYTPTKVILSPSLIIVKGTNVFFFLV